MPVELVDKFKKGSRAELPGSHSHTHTTLAPELGRAASLQRKAGRAICWDVAVACCVLEIRRSVASRAAFSFLIGRSPAVPPSADRTLVDLALAMIGAHGAASLWAASSACDVD
jgi:hypothetical protein